MASRNAWLPTGTMLGRPPRITGFRVASSSGASSSPEAYGGQCSDLPVSGRVGHAEAADPPGRKIMGPNEPGIMPCGKAAARGGAEWCPGRCGPSAAEHLKRVGAVVHRDDALRPSDDAEQI